MQEVLSVSEMRAADAAAIAGGSPGAELMGRAAQGVLDCVRWKPPVAVVCGSGNNGGDGYALALLLRARGIDCRLFRLDERLSPDGCIYYEQCAAQGVPETRWEPGLTLRGFGTVVDCLFGTGFRGRASGTAAEVIAAVNASGAQIVSVDIPSGLHGDSGLGEPCVHADVTVSVAQPQPGHFLGVARDAVGRLVSTDIGIRPVGKPFGLVEAGDFTSVLKPRKNATHKGDYGYVALLGGCLRYSGAAKLANLSQAALRAGCGVATLAVPESLTQAVLPYLLESTLFPMPDCDGVMRYDGAKLDELFGRVRAAGVGMGWGSGPDNDRILRHILNEYRGRLVLDADALNTLAAMDGEPLRHTAAQVVLTPHVREFQRLSGLTKDQLLADPVGHARDYAAHNGVVLLLKGAATIVTDGDSVLLCDRGAPGMATAGSGDVLTGVLTGLLGWSELNPLTVACGAYLCGLAGELAAAEVGDISMTAGDTVRRLPAAIRRLTGVTQPAEAGLIG